MVDLSNKLLLSFLLPNILKKEENNHVFEYTILFLLKKVLIIGSHRIPYKKAIDPCLRLYWNVFLLIYFCNIIETMIKLNSFEIIVTYNQDHIYLSREIIRNFIRPPRAPWGPLDSGLIGSGSGSPETFLAFF